MVRYYSRISKRFYCRKVQSKLKKWKGLHVLNICFLFLFFFPIFMGMYFSFGFCKLIFIYFIQSGIMHRWGELICAKMKIKISVYFVPRVFSIILNIFFNKSDIVIYLSFVILKWPYTQLRINCMWKIEVCIKCY